MARVPVLAALIISAAHLTSSAPSPSNDASKQPHSTSLDISPTPRQRRFERAPSETFYPFAKLSSDGAKTYDLGGEVGDPFAVFDKEDEGYVYTGDRPPPEDPRTILLPILGDSHENYPGEDDVTKGALAVAGVIFSLMKVVVIGLVIGLNGEEEEAGATTTEAPKSPFG